MNDTPIVWMNGELIPADEVRVSPFDLGLTVGLGVFETMVGYDGRVFAYPHHHDRLEQSAEIMGLRVPEIDIIEKAMAGVIDANKLHSGRSRIRVSISGGVNPLAGGDAPGNMIITAVPQTEPCDVATLMVGPHGCDESSAMSGVKSASYACHVMALRHAVSAGADEVLVFNSRGILSEASMANVFLVRDEKVLTPSLTSGCLAGVTRALVIGLCEKCGIPIEQAVLSDEDLRHSDEIFITSSAREVQPAKLLDGKDEAGGPVTKQLSEAYRELVKQELEL